MLQIFFYYLFVLTLAIIVKVLTRIRVYIQALYEKKKKFKKIKKAKLKKKKENC